MYKSSPYFVIALLNAMVKEAQGKTTDMKDFVYKGRTYRIGNVFSQESYIEQNDDFAFFLVGKGDKQITVAIPLNCLHFIDGLGDRHKLTTTKK